MRRAALVAVVVAACVSACGDNRDAPFVPLESGPAQLVVVDGSLVFSRGSTRTVLAPGAFQIGTVDDLDSGASFDPYWLWVDAAPEPPEGLAWHAASAFHVVTSDAAGFTLSLDDDLGRIEAVPTSPGNFRVTLSSARDRVAYLRIQPTITGDEHVFGLGEWPDGIDHRGKLRPMQIEVDTSIESSDNEAHVPVPLMLSTANWGLFVQSDRPGAFDIARMDASRIDVTYGTAGDNLVFHLLSSESSPLDLLQPYYEVAGYPELPVYWAYGPLLWRDENRDQAQVIDDIQQIRTRDLATTGVWFDRPYSTGVNTFDFDAAKFPDARGMLQALHDAGMRYGVWHVPYVAAADKDDPAPEQNAYAKQHNFFPPVTGLPVNGWGLPLDLTNADAYAWWRENLMAYTQPLELGGYGVEGYKLDYGEDIVLGVNGQRVPWKFSDGSDERTMHYGYTMLYHQIYRDTLDQNGGFLLTRTGRWGDQTRGMIIWPGDLEANLSKFGDPRSGASTKSVGGLPTALSFGLGLSASGFPFYASDTGGYRSSPPNNETWLRWVEANAVWPAMQVGDSSSQMPWEFTTENGRTTASLDAYRLYARLHLRLYPYVWSYAAAIRATGRPIARPLGLAFPQLGAGTPDEWLLGDYLLVAPVIEPGATSRDVLIPGGTWLDWWTGAPATPRATADLYTLPLFIARGGIVPMLRDTIDTLSPTTDPSVESYVNDPGMLDVRVALGPNSSFTMFDGTVIEQVTTGVVIADTSTLSFTPGTKFRAGAMFEVIAVATAPTEITSPDGPLTQRASLAALRSAADGWFYDPAQTSGTIWIKVPGAAALTIH